MEYISKEEKKIMNVVDTFDITDNPKLKLSHSHDYIVGYKLMTDNMRKAKERKNKK